MTYDEVRTAVLSLSLDAQKRLIMEVVPAIWPRACVDDACVLKVRELVDEATVKKYRDEHLGGI